MKDDTRCVENTADEKQLERRVGQSTKDGLISHNTTPAYKEIKNDREALEAARESKL